MERLRDYSIMLGITDSMSIEAIELEIARYSSKLKEVDTVLNEATEFAKFLRANVSGLNRMLKLRNETALRENFSLKKEHIALLKRLDFKHFDNGGDYVFIGVEGKRPFGNSDVVGDAAEICGLDPDKDNEEVHQLLYELPFALNHILQKHEI